MTSMNHYEVLEVSPKASLEVIRAAYKSLMQRYHPDKNGGESAERAPLIALAYDVLSNPEKRLAYDRSLHTKVLPEQAPGNLRQRDAVRQAGRPTKPKTTQYAWYAWALIVCIIVAGGMILGFKKKQTTTALPAAHTFAFTPGAGDAAGVKDQPATPLVRPDGRDATPGGQTISAFMTRLSIDLSPDSAGARHVLEVPSLGFRVTGSESARWAQRIELQRSALMQQLLMKLATANYEELIKVDGDLYLKRLIEETVSAGIGLDASGAMPQSAETGQAAQRPLAALLPLSFSVR
jgi:curved DNA-binding protein CbpA